MNRTICLLFSVIVVASACSKKSVPTEEKSTSTSTTSSTKPTVVYRAPVKTPTPKSIVVSDAAAKRTTDGRYYYDLEGKRYWRNKKDGKYYLYYKGIFDNPDFQKK
jgi:ABC-type Fe3+-hydroxamate transport system substrate-binding protein